MRETPGKYDVNRLPTEKERFIVTCDMGRNVLRLQPVDATHASNLSAGDNLLIQGKIE